MKNIWLAACIAAGAVAAPTSCWAQVVASQDVEEIPNPATLARPPLDFKTKADDEQNFDKYFYFHRAETSFVEAYKDIRECDALASGSSIYLDGGPAMAGAMANYGVLAGGLGGAIDGAIADAIFGSSARRAQRRTNLRNCMGFKGYQRYGLNRDLWTAFNFEEGLGRKREPVRLQALALQALVASGPAPTIKELGL